MYCTLPITFLNLRAEYVPLHVKLRVHLNIDDSPVTIKSIERSIIDKAYENGWIVPEININKTNKKIAVVGSGPAGLAASQQLARAGHFVKYLKKMTG